MASAVCAGVQRCSVTRCTTSSLPSGVSFALEWDMRASSSRLVSRNPNPNREALMSHSRAKLSPEGRLLVVQRVTEHRWTPAQTAEAMGVSRATVYKWLHRYREEGEAGLQDRSSRPHRSPRALPRQRVEEILSARRKLHLDTEKLARIPDGGGHKMLGRSSATKRRGAGYEYLHVAVDERGATTAGSLSRACVHFAHAGVQIEAVLTDRAFCYTPPYSRRPAPPSRSDTAPLAPTDPRPTARQSASSAHSCRSVPTPSST